MSKCVGRRQRFAALTMIMAAVALWSDTLALPQQAIAQEGEAAAPAAPSGEAGVEHKEAPNKVAWFFYTIGIIGYGLIALSVYFVSTVGRLFVQLREDVAAPPELSAQLDEMLEQRQFKEIYALVKDDNSFLAQDLATGIAELPNGLADAREAMDRVADSATVEMEKKISMLAVLGTLGPMIGLLGTLKGMIASFAVIAISGQQIKPGEVAEGISEALLLTLLGVGLSVPAIYFYAVFRNRVSAINSAVTLQADYFIRHFAHAARNKSAAPAAAATARAKA